MSRTGDFVAVNFKNAVKVATVNNENDLLKSIKREMPLVGAITRPGNLYDYFSRFTDCHHKYAIAFRRLAEIDRSVITHEQLADYIRTKFPEELDDKYTVDNMVRNKTILHHYENLCVFGGNRQESFRINETNRTIGLILKPKINGFYTDSVVMRLENKKSSTKKRVEKIENLEEGWRVYIMKKLGNNRYLFCGEYRYLRTEKSKKKTRLIFKEV